MATPDLRNTLVTIVAGNGLGLLDTSLATIGAAGVLGEGASGHAGSRAVVNVVNGNLVLEADDAQIAGRGADLLARRTYNSRATAAAGNGTGWRWCYERTVRFAGPGTPAQPGAGATVVRTDGDGHETPYVFDAARAAFIATEGSGAHDELRYDPGAAEWSWTDGSSRVTEHYSNSTTANMTGRLVRRTDPSGNGIAFGYQSGRLSLIRDTASRQELRLHYGTVNGVARARRLEARPLAEDAGGQPTPTPDDPLELVEYGYDGEGRLTTVARRLAPNGAGDGESFVTTYAYADATLRIAGVSEGDGTGLSFIYDADGRVSAVRGSDGSAGAHLAFDYGTVPGTTEVTDGVGRVWALRHDPASGRLTEVRTPPVGNSALSTTFRYDPAGNLAGITDPLNHPLTYTHDASGNRTLERDAAGNTTTRTFGPLNEMLTETRYRIPDPDGAGPSAAGEPATTRYVHDGQARLRFQVSAEGRVTEHRYAGQPAGFGLLSETIVYFGQLLDVAALGTAEPLTEAALVDWVAGLPDRTQVQLTEYRYDLRGNLSQTTSFATVGASGAGILDGQADVAQFIHDAHGRLRERIAVLGPGRKRLATVARFAYDGLGRVLASDGPGGPETVVHDDAGRRTIVTSASGLTETREHDGRGRIVRVTLSGDGTVRTTRFVHDDADRLRMVEDGDGGRRFRFHDAAGRLAFEVDGTGAVTRFEHDGASRLVRTTRYRNRADTGAWYAEESGTVGKATLTVGGPGSDVLADAAHDRVTRAEYDAAGRLVASTDAAGVVTELAYDGLSRVIMTRTGDRVTRYLYDRDGRRVGVVDALGYLTEHRYDAGGRLVQTLRYATRSPLAPNRTAPVWIGVTRQIVVAGRPFECRLPAFDADGDALTLSVVGASPAWLGFDPATATLRGTPPAAPEEESVTLRADDGRGRTSDVTVRLTVVPAAPAPSDVGAGPAWEPLAPVEFDAGAPVSHVVPAAAGPALSYAVVGGLPPALSFDAAAREISGTPDAVGFYGVLLRATDSAGRSTDRTLLVRIRPAATAPAQPAGSDDIAAWRPADPSGLSTFLFHDGRGRVVGAVDERQFLTETVHDDARNIRQTLRYPTPVAVSPDDTLATLKGRAGTPHQLSLVQLDDFGRVRKVVGPDGTTTTRNDYDAAGRLTRVVAAVGTAERRGRRTVYNAFGEVVATLGGEGDAWLGADPTAERTAEAIRRYGLRHAYDRLGRLVRTVDGNGNRTLFFYDREGRRTHTVGVVGKASDGTLAGEVSETVYDSFGQPRSSRRYATRLAKATVETLLAADSGLAGDVLLDALAAIADPSVDAVVHHDHDRAGRLVREVDPEGGVTAFFYDGYGSLAAEARSTGEGRTTTRQLDHDLLGRLVAETLDVGGINATSRVEFDAFGRVVRSVDPTGHATTTAYPDHGRSVIVTDPLQRATRTDHDALGRVVRLTDALGRQTVSHYDETLRSVTVTTPEGHQATTVRSRHGETVAVTDARGSTVRFAHNRDGQPTTVTDALGRVTMRTVYEKSGRPVELTDARGTVTRLAYDGRNRVVERRVDPAGLNLSTRFAFDALGRPVATTEAAGTPAERVMTTAYDRKGRARTVVVDAGDGGLQLSTTSAYDAMDNAVSVARGSVADPNRHVTTYAYDNLGRRVKEVAAPSAVFGPGAPGTRDLTTVFRHDAAGRLSRVVDANGASTWHVHDAAGQMTHTVSALGEVVEHRYDAAGRPIGTRHRAERLPAATLATFGDVVRAVALPAPSPLDRRTHLVRDGDGRQRFALRATGPAGWTVAETRLDPAGNVTELLSYDRFLPDARVEALEAAGPALTVAAIEGELAALGYREDDPATLAGVPRSVLAYDRNNRTRFAVDPTGAVTENVYDAAGAVVAAVRFAARPTLAGRDETAIDLAVDRSDPANRVTQTVRDAAGRLRYTIDATGAVTSTDHDALGNVVATVRWATRPTLTETTEAAIGAALAALPSAGNEVTRLVYDAAGRLRFTVDAVGAVSENAYDPAGNVVATTRFARIPSPDAFTEAALAAATEPLRADPENQVNRFVFDPERRLRFAVDSLGSVTENTYDAGGNLRSTTVYAARPVLGALAEADVAAAVAPLAADPRNRTTRFAYDAADRLRFTVDPLGSVGERRYDGLGNLAATERYAVRPPLASVSEAALEAAVAPLRGHPENRVEHHLHDLTGRPRFSLLRLSAGAVGEAYRVTAHERNALGQDVATVIHAAAVALPTLSEAAILGAVGAGDPARDRVTRFVHDLAGRRIVQLVALTADGGGRRYRAGAQRFDAFGDVVGTSDLATPVAVDDFAEEAVHAAMTAVADRTRDRVSAVARDVLGRPVFSLLALGADTYQVVGHGHDALGHVVRSRQYATAIGPLSRFDLATVGAAAAAVASANDRRTETVRDAAGRPRYVLHADKPGHWTVAESRHDAMGNLVEARRYDRFVTDGWVDGLVATRPLGLREADVAAELAAGGYDDAVPGSLAAIERTRYAYDPRGRLRFTVDALGSVAETVYDALGDAVTAVRYAARPAPAGHGERAIDAAVDRAHAANRIRHTAYDALGQVRFTVDVVRTGGPGAEHLVEERRHDALGELVESRSYGTPAGPLAAYDEATLAAAMVADPSRDRHSAVAYDAGGRQAFAMRELHLPGAGGYVVTRHHHDALGQLVQRVDYARTVPLGGFDVATVAAAVIPQPGGDRTTTYAYDAGGRLRFEVRPDASLRETLHDALDQVTETRRFAIPAPDTAPRTEAEFAAIRGSRAVGDGVTRGERQTWDAAGRLTAQADALGSTETYSYDALGGRTGWTDRNGGVFACSYDRRGRKAVETTPPLRFKLRGEPLATPAPDRTVDTRFHHDAFGNLIRTVDAANFPDDAATTDVVFDTAGRPTAMLYNGFHDPAAAAVVATDGPGRFRREASIAYDPLGNAVRFAVRTGPGTSDLTWRTHDPQGRVVHEVNALGHVTRYGYNAFGDRAVVTRYSVTVAGTPANGEYWTADEIEPQLNFGLDEGGNVIEDWRARTVRLAFDTLGRKTAVTMPEAEYYSTRMPGNPGHASPFRLTPAAITRTLDAAATRYEYNAFGDLTRQRVRANTVVEWQDTTFTVDAMGRRTRMVDAAGNVTTTSYDLAGNLVHRAELTGLGDGSDRIASFAYDVLDREIRVDRYGLRYTDSAGFEHGVATWTWENGGEWLDPDADVATTVRTASYDPYGRPLAVTDAAGNLTELRYDALGRVVEIVAPARVVAPAAVASGAAVDPFRDRPTETLVTRMTLDPFGRAVRQVRATAGGAEARIIEQAYDVAGNLVAITDPEGGVRRRAIDHAGRVIRETQAIAADLGPLGVNAEGRERRYHYDALGQLTDTLDVYLDGADRKQSGQSVLYNPFGEVTEERRKWGPADADPAALSMARVAWYHHDNAGHVFEKLAFDRLTLYSYNLLGRLTREEKRGNSGDSDGTGHRVAEMEYDILGRMTMIRRPAFEADVTPGTGTTLRLVTPYTARSYDRWGNVRGTDEGGYEVAGGQPAWAPSRIFRGYRHDDNDRVVTESLGTHGFTSATGVATNALISRHFRRDLLGNVVAEVDEARDPQSEALISARTRRKAYDAVGHLTAETDATGRKVEFVANIHGERVATRNARGTVFVDRRDRNGRVVFRSVLRTMGPAGPGEYDSFAGTGTIAHTFLSAHLHDAAGRRFASKRFSTGADAPWTYTWFDGRNLGVKQRDAMGRTSEYRFDPFGNKAVEIDSGGARSAWTASTEDYHVGRIETYQLPAEAGLAFGQYIYNDYGEVRMHLLGNTRTEYDRGRSGLVAIVTIRPDVTQNAQEMTRYAHDVHGQVTMEGRFDADSIQTKLISYDNQRRLSRVEDQNKAPFGPTADVQYAYDEWGNVRRIQATYMRTIAEGPQTRTSWYAYDLAGRMTVSDGTLSGGAIALKPRSPGSARISYDAVGRREGTTELQGSYSAGPFTARRSWDALRDEAYAYDDLGHLRRIDQRVRLVNIVRTNLNGSDDPVPEPSKIGPFHPLSIRSTDLRGDVTRSEQWTRLGAIPGVLSVDHAPTHLGVSTAAFHADGQVAWTRFDAVDPKKSTVTENTYAPSTGLLSSYLFKAFRTDGVPFEATFEYFYAFQQGERVVRRIRSLGTSLDTFKTYDRLGRLFHERIDLPKPNGPGSDRFEERRYEHGADGRIIFKDSEMRLSASGPGTVPLDQPTSGEQTYVYAGSRIAATVGAGRLATATRFDFAYTPMTEASGRGAGRYVVQSGESLIDIAQAAYGDGALWYVIADANSVTADPAEPLPSTEVGKAYELPDIVRSTQSATTTELFGLPQIIGNDRPIAVPPPPPPRHSDIEIMARAAASITVQVGATVGLSALGVPLPVSAAIGAGLGNLTGQATSWSLGMQPAGQDGIDWGGVGLATMEGYLFSVAGPAAAISREVWTQAKGGFEGWTGGPGLNWTGIGGSLFNVGFDALGPTLGGARVGTFSFGIGSLVNSAYNPSSGWAIPGSGRSPAVGAFEYAFGAVANGAAAMAYDWIRDRLDRPTPPPAPPRPRSVDDPRGPLPADLLDMWDEIDRQYTAELDAAALLARNARTAAESDERIVWQLRLGELEDRIAHFGEGIDDRAIIASVRRQHDAERVQRDRAAAVARARAAARAARLRANSARIEAQLARGPDPSLLQYARDMDELNNQIVRDMYAEGTFVRVSQGVNLDGLGVDRGSGIYDTMGMYARRNSVLDEEIRRYQEFRKADPSLVGLEVIAVEDIVTTPAAQARRLGLAEVKTFDQFTKRYARDHGGSTAGVEKAFLEYHDQRSREINRNWDRIDNAAGAVNLIARGTFLGVQFIFDPVGTVVGLGLEIGTEEGLKLAGVDPQTAAMVGGIAGAVGGGAVAYRQMTRATQGSVRDVLRAERAARAEYDAARLAAGAAEFEMAKGIRVAEGVTLFRGVPPAARVARPAHLPAALDAPSAPPALVVARDGSGGVPALAGRDVYPPLGTGGALSYEAGVGRSGTDALRIGGDAPRIRSVANVTDGSGGFTGGGGPGGGPVAGGAADGAVPTPAIYYDAGDATRLVTVDNGVPFYQSSGRSRSQLAGHAGPHVKEEGQFYAFHGIQETPFVSTQSRAMSETARSTLESLDPGLAGRLTTEDFIHRGWLFKGYHEKSGRFLGADIPKAPHLRERSFSIEGTFTEPEQVNQWLAAQGAPPWVDARHFFHDPVGFDLDPVADAFRVRTMRPGPSAPADSVIVDWAAFGQ